jgi:hypothetical protein
MSIIEGAAMRCRTMADGSLRIEIEVEPRNAQAAFVLFGAPGRAVALAALKDGASAVAEPEPEKPKGGQWAKLAGMWCNDPDFWAFANGKTVRGIIWHVEDARTAKAFMRHACDMDSRVELDNDPQVLHAFNERIRHPFMKWMQARGINK